MTFFYRINNIINNIFKKTNLKQNLPKENIDLIIKFTKTNQCHECNNEIETNNFRNLTNVLKVDQCDRCKNFFCINHLYQENEKDDCLEIRDFHIWCYQCYNFENPTLEILESVFLNSIIK